jgi:hypothetical protein
MKITICPYEDSPASPGFFYAFEMAIDEIELA